MYKETLIVSFNVLCLNFIYMDRIITDLKMPPEPLYMN